MRERKGTWQDILTSHALAVDAKKVWLGFIATLGTLALLVIISFLYDLAGGTKGAGQENIIVMLLAGQCTGVLLRMLPFFNPFAAGWLHFIFSGVFYVLLLAVWSYSGSTITRLTALQYARDDIPTLNDALEMVRKKRKAFFFAPLTPLLGVLLFGFLNQLAGLAGSIPIIGPWILTILIPIGILPGTIVLTFIAVLGVLSFGLMLPSISIGGKDAFEGWSSAFSYLLWGFNRFVGYSLLAAVLGIISVMAAAGLSELFIALMNNTVSVGLIGESLVDTTGGEGIFRLSISPLATGPVGLQAASWVTIIIALLIRLLVPAFAFSYFFSANTIICFLMRKHVDRVEIDDVYYEEPEQNMESEEGDEAEEESKEEAQTEIETEPEGTEASEEKSGEEAGGLDTEEETIEPKETEQEPESGGEDEAPEAEEEEDTEPAGSEEAEENTEDQAEESEEPEDNN